MFSSKVLKPLLMAAFLMGVSQSSQAAGGYQTACDAWCGGGSITCGIVATDFSFSWTSSCNSYGNYIECFTLLPDGSFYPGSYQMYNCN